jgi:pilus assembly protein CpaE
MNANLGANDRSRILICSRDPDAIRVMDGVFSSLAAYDTIIEPLEQLLGRKTIETDGFDAAIVDIANGAVLDDPRFAEFRGKLGRSPVIFISSELPTERMRQLIKLDGTDWLPKPLQTRALIDTVNSVTQRLKANGNRVYAVLPCGGGSGGTCVSIMLAYYLSRAHKRNQPSAALFDLDFSRAAVSAYLNTDSNYDLTEVLGRPERIDLEFIDIIKRKHPTGFSVFSHESPALMTHPQGAEIVLRMLDIVAFQHDHTVVDLTSCEAKWTQQVLAAVNRVVIVTTNSIPGLQRAKNLVRRVSETRGDGKDIAVVINKVHGSLFNPGIKKKDIVRIFGQTSATVLPYEFQVLTEALNRGVLPIDVNPWSGFCGRIKQVADEVRATAQVAA